MRKSTWTEARLRRLFDRYDRRYWRGTLHEYRVEVAVLDGIYGDCRWKMRRIRVDPAGHRSDREVGSTLLHEMAHAATAGDHTHGSRFLAEIERLLRLGAPIDLTFPDAPSAPRLRSIPRRLRRVRKALRRAFDAERRRVERKCAELEAQGQPVQIVDLDQEFEDAGSEGCSWTAALALVAQPHGLLDVDMRPLPHVEPKVAGWKRAHRRGRRARVEERHGEAIFRARAEATGAITIDELAERSGVPRGLVAKWARSWARSRGRQTATLARGSVPATCRTQQRGRP